MKTIYVKTTRITSHKNDGSPINEVITQKLQENSFAKFLKYLPYQNYVSAIVEKVIDFDKKGEIIELDEVKIYQNLIDDSKLNKEQKTTKELYEEEKKRNDDLEKRLKALEDNKQEEITAEQRIILIDKAGDLEIKFNKNISSKKLLEKIQEVEPEFEL